MDNIDNDFTKIKEYTKYSWLFIWSIIILVIELLLLLFYTFSVVDEITKGSLATLGAGVISIYIGTLVCIISLRLAFLNYKQNRKILALILFSLGLSVTFPFGISIGKNFAPLFPSVKQVEIESRQRYEYIPPKITKEESDKLAKIKTGEDHLNQLRNNYLENRFSELENSFKDKVSIVKIVQYWNYVQLSDGRKISLIYSNISDKETWEKIDMKNIQLKLPDFDDFKNQYLLHNNLVWSDNLEQTVGLVCPSDITDSNRDDACSEKIPVLAYENKVLINELFNGSNRDALIKYRLQ